MLGLNDERMKITDKIEDLYIYELFAIDERTTIDDNYDNAEIDDSEVEEETKPGFIDNTADTSHQRYTQLKSSIRKKEKYHRLQVRTRILTP
eukprot:UN16979